MAKTVETIQPVERIRGRVRVPGSKSVTHRALMLAALARGESEILDALRAEDTELTARALEHLGVTVAWDDRRVLVRPPASRWEGSAEVIHLGNSGTSMRLLLGIAAAGKGDFVFDGTPRLRERPVGPVIDALRRLGVRAAYLGREGYPPVRVQSDGLTGGSVWVDARESSQFVSALVMAASAARSDVEVCWEGKAASLPYLHLTVEMMRRVGLRADWIGSNGIRVPGRQEARGFRYQVEGDCSSASYFWAAAALTGGEVFTYPLTAEALQGDCRFLAVLEAMGCTVVWEEEGVRVLGPERLRPVDLDMNDMPDMVPTLAVLAAFAPGTTRIRNVAHLRIKESDRIRAVAEELAKLAVPVDELPDGLVISGGGVKGAVVEAHDDHRIAMAFAVAGLKVPGISIAGAETVSKSFPKFWEVFRKLSHG